MRTGILLALVRLGASVVALSSARSEGLADDYKEFGRLIVTQFVSAPFPHPDRAQGHKYKDKFFPAKEHYSDSTVAMFIPKDFRETGQIDFVVHFHGWGNNVAGALKRYHLIEQMAESGRNAVLVVPEGPRNASDSFGGKLEDADGFKKFMAEAVEVLRRDGHLKKPEFTMGNIVLSGHSGGYHVMAAIVDRGGLSEKVREVWLFDALYGQTEKFVAWYDHVHGRLLNIYTEHGGTKDETEKLIEFFKKRATPCWAGKEVEIKAQDLQAAEPIFLFSDLAHDQVMQDHGTFRQFLETSCLKKTE